MSTRIAPSLLSANPLTFGVEIKTLEECGADFLHIDVMDGHFTGTIGCFSPNVVKHIHSITSVPLCVHLMVQEPYRFIDMFAHCGVQYMAIHPESTQHILKDLQNIRFFGMKPGIALNPGTPLWVLEPLWDDVDFVLLMGVNPGSSGQSMIPSTFQRLQHLKTFGRDKEIWVDGGVKLTNHKTCIDNGADVLVIGSDLFNAPSIKEHMELLKQ